MLRRPTPPSRSSTWARATPSRRPARDLARRASSAPARRHGHKIDSTLRGNWAHELVSVQQGSGEPVLVVPAFPRLGRTCRGGVVHVDGEPIEAHDARCAASSPRPADHLVAAGATDVVELADAAAVARWSATGDGSFAVCDASTDDDLAAIAAAWRDAGGLRFAGTAGSVAAAVAATSGPRLAVSAVALDDDALVVCGSLHPLARTQVAAVRDVAGVTVLSSPVPDRPSVTGPDADRAAAALAAAAHELLATGRFGVVVIVGGDTAAAVLGDERDARRRYGRRGDALVATWRRQRTAGRDEGRRVRAPDHARRAAARPFPDRGAMTIDTIPMAVTMGDASGVGPEIVLRRFAAGGLGDDVVVYGDASILVHGADLLGLDVDVHPLASRWASAIGADRVPSTSSTSACSGPTTTRRACSTARGAAARQYVVRATEDALAGRVGAVVTMPMNKEATQLSDPRFVGHTEMIAELCGVQRVSMMLTAALEDGSSLAVTHVSTHCSLREAIERVRPRRVLDVIELTDATLRRFLDVPRHRGLRAQPARRRARPVRRRGRRADRPGDRGGARCRASTPADPIPPTPSSTKPCTATATTRSCACTTTRATRR